MQHILNALNLHGPQPYDMAVTLRGGESGPQLVIAASEIYASGGALRAF
jgi:hypothetical protein